MAMNVQFLKGLKAKLPSTRDANTFYYVTDEFALYLGNNLISNEVTLEQFNALAGRVKTLEDWKAALPEYVTKSVYDEHLTAQAAIDKKQTDDIAQLKSDLEGVVAEGGEPNKVDDIKVNGATIVSEKIANFYVEGEMSEANKLVTVNYMQEEDKFDGDIPTVNALGGIPANTVLKNKTTHEILDMLLFPYVKPIVATPTRTPSTTTALEKGDTQTVTQVSAKVTKKSKPITKVELYQGNTLIATKEGDDLPNITTSGTTVAFSGLNISVPSTNVTFTVKVTDEQGSVVTSGATASWSFVYPYYYGVCESDAVINEALVESLTKDIAAKGQKTYSYTANNQKMVIAYPKTHKELSKVLDQNGFDNTGAFKATEVNITGLDGTAQAYYVYTNDPSSVTSFKMTFTHKS